MTSKGDLTEALGGIGHSSSLLQAISVSKDGEFELPIRTPPVNFAVLREDGKVSNTWGVTVAGRGDAYIYCRDSMKGQKVSLHASGKQHVSFDKSVTSLDHFQGNRFMNQWREPVFDKEAVATFALVFPVWGVGLTYAQMKDALSTWRKNELYIVGHDGDLTLVLFFILDAGKTLVHRGPGSSLVIAELSLRPGKTLHVVACREPEGEFRKSIEMALGQVTTEFTERGMDAGEYGLCFTGNWGQTNYMVALSATYTPPDPS